MKVKIKNLCVIDCPNPYSSSSKSFFSWFIKCESGYLMICHTHNNSNYVFLDNGIVDISAGRRINAKLIKK